MSQDMNQQKDAGNTGQESIKPPVKRKKRRHRFGAGMAVGALAVLLIGACAWGVKVYLYGGFPFDTYASGEVSEDDVAVKLVSIPVTRRRWGIPIQNTMTERRQRPLQSLQAGSFPVSVRR